MYTRVGEPLCEAQVLRMIAEDVIAETNTSHAVDMIASLRCATRAILSSPSFVKQALQKGLLCNGHTKEQLACLPSFVCMVRVVTPVGES